MEILSSTCDPTDSNIVSTVCNTGAITSLRDSDPVFFKALLRSLHDVCLKALDFRKTVQISGCLFFRIDGAYGNNIDIYETVHKEEQSATKMNQMECDESDLKVILPFQTDAVKTTIPFYSNLLDGNPNTSNPEALEPTSPITKKFPQLLTKLTGAKRRKFKQSRKLTVHNELKDGSMTLDSSADPNKSLGVTVKSRENNEDTLSEGEITLRESDDSNQSDYKPESPDHFPLTNKSKTTEKQLPKKKVRNEVGKSIKQNKVFFKKKFKKKLPKKEYPCNQCSFITTALKKLLAHQKASHENSGLQCPDCGKTLSCSLALRRHHNSIHKGVRFSCELCQKDFSSQHSLSHHKRGEHGNIKPFKCKQCDMSFKFHHSLKLHILKHSGARPYKCPHCDKTYLTSSHLKEHVTVVHAETRNHCCSTCGKRFGYLQSLREHEKTHTSERPHTCSVCQKGFISLTSLKTHQGTHINSREFKCDECGKFYKTEILLKIHKRRHTQAVSRFMCDICGLRFMFKSNLKMHAAVHSDIKQFRCKVCGKTFKTYPTLYSHVQIHNPENTFSCTICSKLFKTKARQSAHEKRHTEQKKHACEQCLKLFSSKGDLGKHKRTVHSSCSRYSCPLCGKVSSRCDNIRGHLLRVHGKTSQEYSVELLRIGTGPNEEELFNHRTSALITNMQSDSSVLIPQSLPNPRENCGEANFMPIMPVHHAPLPHNTSGHPPEHHETTCHPNAPHPLSTHVHPPQHFKEGTGQYMRDMLRTYDPSMPIPPVGTPNYGWSINH